MIGYTTLGTNNLEKSAQFYDALLAELGASRTMESDTYVTWSTSSEAPALAVTVPFDGQQATVGNGVMVALQLSQPSDVDRLYKKAIELGAQDEGEAGPREGGFFYAGYFRDLDGNKVNFFCLTQPE